MEEFNAATTASASSAATISSTLIFLYSIGRPRASILCQPNAAEISVALRCGYPVDAVGLYLPSTRSV